MKIARVDVAVSDDFEPHCCYDCPFGYDDYYDDDGWTECERRCIFSCDISECPIQLIEMEEQHAHDKT